LLGGHRNLRSRGITDYLVTAITVTHCDGRDSTDVQYPPFGAARERGLAAGAAVHNRVIWLAGESLPVMD
jgi:hypothetical protein